MLVSSIKTQVLMRQLFPVPLHLCLDYIPCRLFRRGRSLRVPLLPQSPHRLFGLVPVERHGCAVVQLERRLEVGGDSEAVDEGVDRPAARERRQPVAHAFSRLNPQTRGRVSSLAYETQLICVDKNDVSSYILTSQIPTSLFYQELKKWRREGRRPRPTSRALATCPPAAGSRPSRRSGCRAPSRRRSSARGRRSPGWPRATPDSARAAAPSPVGAETCTPVAAGKTSE